MNAITQTPLPLADIEAEQIVLGSILNRNELVDLIGGILESKHFYEPIHAKLYENIVSTVRAGRSASPITLKAFLERDNSLQDVGGASYVARLAGAVASNADAEAHAKNIRELWIRREIIRQSTEAIAVANDLPLSITAQALATESAERLVGLSANGAEDRIADVFEVADAALTAIQRRRNGEPDEGLIKTGLEQLDSLIGGMARGDFVILAGRPGMGKSALADCIGLLAAQAGYVTLLWSGEMRRHQIAERLLSSLSYSGGAIPYTKAYRSGQCGLTDSEYSRLCEARHEHMRGLPLFLDDRPKVNLGQLRAKAAQIKIRKGGLDLLIVDQLGNILPTNNYRGNRVLEVSETTGGLKQLAVDLNVPIIAVHQLSRQVEGRENKRPMLSDLRDSGAAEQDADMVWFAFREEYYVKAEIKNSAGDKLLKLEDKLRDVKNRLEIIVEKQRRGPTGTVTQFCDIGSNFIGPMANEQQAQEAML